MNDKPIQDEVDRLFRCTRCRETTESEDEMLSHLMSEHDGVGRDGRYDYGVSIRRPLRADDDQWLIALCGLPGVGKSTVASYVMEHTDATRLRTDVIRKELFDEPEYTKAERDTVYQTLHDRAEEHLDAGESVVLDATFAQGQYRRPLQHIVDEHDVKFQFVEVVCEESVVEDRIAEREGISDADFEVYQQFKRTFDPLETDHVTVDNSTSRADTRAQVDRLF